MTSVCEATRPSRRGPETTTASRLVYTSARRVRRLDGEPFEEKMARLVMTLREQQAEGRKLDAATAASLRELGYGM
jgi:hypothetical protein